MRHMQRVANHKWFMPLGKAIDGEPMLKTEFIWQSSCQSDHLIAETQLPMTQARIDPSDPPAQDKEAPQESKVEKGFRHEKTPPLPFLALLDGAQLSNQPSKDLSAAENEQNEKEAAAIKVLLKHVSGDKTVSALLRANTESDESRKEISEAALVLLLMGFETVYVANEDALKTRLQRCG